MKNLFYSTLLILLFACGNNVEPLDPAFFIKEPEPDEIKISIEGLDDIDYTSVTAITIDSTATITTDGIFKNPYTPNDVEDLPVLLLENEEILMGYFPHTLKSNKADIDDILLFYFLTYPELAIQGYDFEFVLDEIKGNDDYLKIKQLVVSELNLNKSPLNNEEFNNLIRKITSEIRVANGSETSKSKKGIDTFKFTYDRDGKVSWLEEFPLYAAVGVEIKNTTTGDVVMPPKILQNKSLVLSPGSAISWIFNELFTDNNEINIESFSITKDGEYAISFSNGNGNTSQLNDFVSSKNNRYLASNLMGYILPISIKYLNIQPSCTNAIDEVVSKAFVTAAKIALEGKVPETSDLLAFLYSLSEDAADIITNCMGPETSPGVYFRILTSSVAKRLATIEDVATLVFLIRDSIGTTVEVSETRYFDNGISFGILKGKDESEIKFEGESESIHYYSKVYEEYFLSYDIDRGVLSSSVKLEEEWKAAEKLPFIPTLISGDADVSDNLYDADGQINSSPDGEIKIKMVMGKKESEVEINPDFTSSFAETQTVTLTPPSDIKLVGNMDFGEVKINTAKGEVLVIENNTDQVMTITSINLPTGYTSTWENKPIQPNSSESFIVVFEPELATEYSGEIVVNNNLDNINNKISAIGFGVDDRILLEGNMNFGNVVIKPGSPPTKILSITNKSLDKSMTIQPLQALPDGFTAVGWLNGGVLSPGEKQDIEITFNPQEVKDYSFEIVVDNNLDDDNNKINVQGNGVPEQAGIDGIWKTEYIEATGNSQYINNKEWVFETSATDETSGIISFKTLPPTNDVYKKQTFNLNGDNLVIDMETEYFAGPDRVTRTFTFSGTYRPDTDTYEGEFSYLWRHFTTGGQTRRSNGTLKFIRQ